MTLESNVHVCANFTNVSCVISNEAFELHRPKLLATNEKTHASFRIAPNTNVQVRTRKLS